MHKQQVWPQAWEYCQAKPIQTLGRASQGVNWSWSPCIKSHHTETSPGKGLPSWFHFPAGLGTCPHCQRYQKLVRWPWCYCAWLASKLSWPEPHRESMEYCQEEDERHQTQQNRWYQSNLGFHYTWAVPQADRLHATPHWCSNSCKRRPNHVLNA